MKIEGKLNVKFIELCIREMKKVSYSVYAFVVVVACSLLLIRKAI
jgi:hypothetical protein